MVQETEAADMTDEQKHEHMRRMGYPHAVFLPPAIYEVARAKGYDMRQYVKTQPIPTR